MPECDLIIHNAMLLDGLGGPAVTGGVAVRGDRIAAIGKLEGWRGGEAIDAKGQCLAPGFIDVHTHHDQAVLEDPGVPFVVSQGVTSVIVGNCGISLAPLDGPASLPEPLALLGQSDVYRYPTFAAYFDALEQARPAVNVGVLAGHGVMRTRVMDDVARPATAPEIAQMCALLDEALAAGVLGLSTGLAYPVATHAPTAEVVSIARRLAAYPGARYVTHMRDERDGVAQSVAETLEIGRDAGVPVVISHHKCIGCANFGRSGETLAMIDAALREQDVALDQYPYDASSTVLLPQKVKDADRILIAQSSPHPEAQGRYLDDIAAEMGCDPEEAARRLMPGVAIYFQMSEDDIARIMTHPRVMIGSDGIPGPNAHPRLWGAFPRVLRRYVREKGVLSLPEAVRRMTSLPAQVFGLARRGRLQGGFYADLVLFDPETIADRADYVSPALPSEGVAEVFVNGRPVLSGDPGRRAGAGRILRRSQSSA
ncbi:D-aminoacylase [Roseovarius spongiae]|uniref:D-aminoacylase n=1 Tax=Roseovarius spongiae TaxID=2320272 RepID=A0A3A8B2F3_9RHOB|nr:D-aminoacylase [Roseovarius spongiae]RKF13583.1 D-aminoacylase [Roseovarius spongiae]